MTDIEPIEATLEDREEPWTVVLWRVVVLLALASCVWLLASVEANTSSTGRFRCERELDATVCQDVP